MYVINARNVHQALPMALHYLFERGMGRNSRNGPVLLASSPVTTRYEFPTERVVFWPERDANPFLHLYESLWMLAGRNDVEPLKRYTQQFDHYSDDGVTLHGAYGHRWRHWQTNIDNDSLGFDQLPLIADALRNNPDDRRCVLTMWDPARDLGKAGKDVPCNDVITFQCGFDGELNMTVFCRSNDIVWGAYGANAVHLSMLQEYMAGWIGCPVGWYEQVSVNWHGYLNTLDKVRELDYQQSHTYVVPDLLETPYDSGRRRSTLPPVRVASMWENVKTIAEMDAQIAQVLRAADNGFRGDAVNLHNEFFQAAFTVLWTHHVWKAVDISDRFDAVMAILDNIREPGTITVDWVEAARQWFQRREAKRMATLTLDETKLG